jgi:hypothetical protein
LARLPAIFQGADERLPRLAETEAILPVHIVGMKLNLNRLPDDAIHVPGFGGEDGGVVWLDVVSQVDTVLRQGWLVRMF